jgi:prepilin-type N-terminal cleavage/methylation domain-containing protein
MMLRTSQKGFTLVEIIVTLALAAVLVLAIITLNVQSLKVSRLNMVELRASLYVSEALEIGKDLELSNWNHLKTSTCTSASSCHPSIPSAGGAWTLVSGSETLDNSFFTRSVWIEQVERNICTFPNTIVSSGVVCPTPANPDSLKYVASVAWTDDTGTHTQTLEAFLHDLP